MSFTDNWSDEEFIRQMKELIGNEGDIHVTCNHSEGEQVTETHVHTESSLVSCSERMPDSKTAVLVAREFDRKGDWRMKWATYIPGHPDANDGWIIPGASWIPSHWMPLPEPPKEVNRG
ncbi:DUF551 domain-containing protein [Escherichia coli]|nr:DUF551 domain-containing protein [Escherichia coli]MTD76581.1 DUF551 domain-containing protein [Escherichia coli]HAX2634254.1 DUF551 domain-containing protein [Escherichia coli]